MNNLFCPGCNHELIRESYPDDPENRTIIHKFLCVGCGYTRRFMIDEMGGAHEIPTNNCS